MENIVFSVGNTYRGKVVNRPSKTCKSPYVADVELENGEIVISHAPSLGCCGYVDKDQYIYMTMHENPKTCSHVVQIAERNEKNTTYLVGVHPKTAEKIVNVCLEKGLIDTLLELKNIQSEQKYLNSRFDFVCNDKNGNKVIIEVKNVPCGDYEDILSKHRKKKDYVNNEVNSKIAYFPDGYRKKQTDTVSPRALKHIQELEQLKEENVRTVIIFVVQRPDCVYFQGSNVDPIYKSALNKAYSNGVEVIPIRVIWDCDGNCYYDKIIPFVL
tara:strand:- start:12085 stop:12897 length:813 start_codon:yes stop_codon:yes gene_type:complete